MEISTCQGTSTAIGVRLSTALKFIRTISTDLPHEAMPVSKLESGALKRSHNAVR
jgi:hypothetical protein